MSTPTDGNVTVSHLQPIILHAHPTSPNPHKIAIALEYLRVPYTVRLWQFGDDARRGVKGEDFLRITPNGRVPAIEDSNTGVVAWESGAIMNYLKRQYDTTNVLGPKSKGKEFSEQDRVDLETWEYLLLTTLAPMTGQAVWFRHYHVPRNEDALDRYTKQVYHYLGVLEGQLGRSGGRGTGEGRGEGTGGVTGGGTDTGKGTGMSMSILPGGISSVDCHFFPWVRPFEYVGISLDGFPLVSKWCGFMAEQQEVKDAYQKMLDATALQDPAATSRGLQPDEELLREVQSRTPWRGAVA
ncbi:hypothetical protein A1O3_08963 [Capronia epimyces CBS 606.96]|uniref:Glutathione S-transferase n=1 Tax=Capronia epimyces CBS 606.96 TaxID=1182542 RepID=W9XR68_9EURO|nr:uncharacterized protein A1O3_08963 [Capronia epimyces CBS 606.96]EXJ79461.1 hypothetical protein A1O3_08963 [Capronia epimyces CBS 606.96]